VNKERNIALILAAVFFISRAYLSLFFNIGKKKIIMGNLSENRVVDEVIKVE
jgi:hypothetical protein